MVSPLRVPQAWYVSFKGGFPGKVPAQVQEIGAKRAKYAWLPRPMKVTEPYSVVPLGTYFLAGRLVLCDSPSSPSLVDTSVEEYLVAPSESVGFAETSCRRFYGKSFWLAKVV